MPDEKKIEEDHERFVDGDADFKALLDTAKKQEKDKK